MVEAFYKGRIVPAIFLICLVLYVAFSIGSVSTSIQINIGTSVVRESDSQRREVGENVLPFSKRSSVDYPGSTDDPNFNATKPGAIAANFFLNLGLLFSPFFFSPYVFLQEYLLMHHLFWHSILVKIVMLGLTGLT